MSAPKLKPDDKLFVADALWLDGPPPPMKGAEPVACVMRLRAMGVGWFIDKGLTGPQARELAAGLTLWADQLRWRGCSHCLGRGYEDEGCPDYPHEPEPRAVCWWRSFEGDQFHCGHCQRVSIGKNLKHCAHCGWDGVTDSADRAER